MKSELEQSDIEAIARRVAEILGPLLHGVGQARDRNGNDEIFDVPAACAYLKVSKRWLYERVNLTEIPYSKIKGALRFKKAEIDKWLDRHGVPAASAVPRKRRAGTSL